MRCRPAAGRASPDAVQHVPVGIDPDVKVGREDLVEPADLLVPEEGVRHPHLAGVRHGQVFDPLLTKTNLFEG